MEGDGEEGQRAERSESYRFCLYLTRVSPLACGLLQVNGEFFALTYGAMVMQLVKDFEDVEEVRMETLVSMPDSTFLHGTSTEMSELA